MTIDEFFKRALDRKIVTPLELVLKERAAMVQTLVKEYIDARKRETNSTY